MIVPRRPGESDAELRERMRKAGYPLYKTELFAGRALDEYLAELTNEAEERARHEYEQDGERW